MSPSGDGGGERREVAVAAACAERLRAPARARERAMDAALELLWRDLAGAAASDVEIVELLERCWPLVGEDEAAEPAAMVVVGALQARLTGDPAPLEWALRRGREAGDELALQQADRAELAACDAATVERVRRRAAGNL